MIYVRLVVVLMCMIFIGSAAEAATNIIPEGAIFDSQIMERATAPEGFSTALAWAQVATIKQTKEEALVLVKYLRLVEIVNGKAKIIAEERYDKEGSYVKGGLYTREPKWFANADHSPIKNSQITHGVLEINASLTPDKIIHWWTEKAEITPGGTYYVETEVKIKGSASIQLGLDYWVDKSAGYNGFDKKCIKSHNCEGFVGNWYGDTNGKFIVIRSPQ